MTRTIRIGISTCPNDTFAFHALLERIVPTPGLELDFHLADVEELNEYMLARRLDAAKVSFHAALAMHDRVVVLPAGAALGFGIGPALLGAPGHERFAFPPGVEPHVLAPGRWTTATLLMRLLHPEVRELEQVLFSAIMPALREGRADYGVCIHEGRFTWREAGLHWVEDLGKSYEAASGTALPLGGIVARADLGPEELNSLASAIRRSLEWAHENRAACLPTMRRYAQEQTDDVLWRHVELYVNARTLDLGEEGRTALETLGKLARENGLLPPGEELRVL